jgi:formate hydrogenlyase subunit 3/multisubunit Na+/H+ antiporter MnhD subunit
MEADRRFDVLNAVVVVGLLGLPLTATFSGSWLLLQDSFRFGSAATKWFLLAFVLMAWSVVDGLSIMRAARNEKVQWLATWPLLIALLWVGLAPQFVISRLQTQNAAESSEAAEAE